MQFLRSLVGVFGARGLRAAVVVALGAGLACGAAAQPAASAFPREALRFVEAELPAMNQAVAAGNRAYFSDAMGRMLDFSESWGFKAHTNPALAPYQACTSAVQDFLLVGLCKLTPGGADCTPQVAGDFDRNLNACRASAR